MSRPRWRARRWWRAYGGVAPRSCRSSRSPTARPPVPSRARRERGRQELPFFAPQWGYPAAAVGRVLVGGQYVTGLSAYNLAQRGGGRSRGTKGVNRDSTVQDKTSCSARSAALAVGHPDRASGLFLPSVSLFSPFPGPLLPSPCPPASGRCPLSSSSLLFPFRWCWSSLLAGVSLVCLFSQVSFPMSFAFTSAVLYTCRSTFVFGSTGRTQLAEHRDQGIVLNLGKVVGAAEMLSRWPPMSGLRKPRPLLS